MNNRRNSGCCLLAGLLITTSTMGEEFDFEVGITYDSTQFDGRQTITTPGGTLSSSSSTDTNNLGLLGSWYYAGLSDDKGPRARAVLVDRASSVRVAYSRLDQKFSTTFDSDDPALILLPGFDSTLNSDGDSFAVDLRHVDRDSGWFGHAGLLNSDATLSGAAANSFDATGWSLGIGKYLFDATTLGLDYSQVNVEGGRDATLTAVSFTHLGNRGARWQYAIDLGYRRLDADFGGDLDTWRAAIALYPTRDFEFGIAVEDVSGNTNGSFGLSGTTGIEGFASWFVTPNVSLAARVRVDDDADDPGFASFAAGPIIAPGSAVSDADQDSFGVSATMRF